MLYFFIDFFALLHCVLAFQREILNFWKGGQFRPRNPITAKNRSACEIRRVPTLVFCGSLETGCWLRYRPSHGSKLRAFSSTRRDRPTSSPPDEVRSWMHIYDSGDKNHMPNFNHRAR
ncbi:hypothetical protein AVEN_253709-1 [Araneus ventricosus]|uniref:Secreted protein n=1 Tax=Araneus ventricosus TaxID=182803 RepID=A0A4Y2DZ49_ARAVE|nr:hypothetical protein AVEN_253709-1 [Araneus ventricosus]